MADEIFILTLKFSVGFKAPKGAFFLPVIEGLLRTY